MTDLGAIGVSGVANAGVVGVGAMDILKSHDVTLVVISLGFHSTTIPQIVSFNDNKIRVA